MRQYLLVFAQIHEDFRLAELRALDDLLHLGLELAAEHDVSRPFMLVRLPGEEEARRLGSRAILIRHIIEHWADAADYDDLHQANRASPHNWEPYVAGTSFKVSVQGYQTTLSEKRRLGVVNSLAYTGLRGPIRLMDPELEIVVWEEHIDATASPSHDAVGNKLSRLERVWLGRKVCDGQRYLVDVMDLKKRVFIGNTSMEASMSLLMANQAHCRPGTIALDPFCGTGSMLYPAAHFGSLVFGCDIDGRQMKGKGKGIRDGAAQYGVADRLLDFATCDLTQGPWRTGGIFDAIITDPPYGVRAGAKKLGRSDATKLKDAPHRLPNGEWSHQMPGYVPPTRVWEMSEVLVGLLRFSRRMLKVGGRLVYWLPTTTEEYRETDVPRLEGMEVVGNSCQPFNKWERRLITMRKVAEFPEDEEFGTPTTAAGDSSEGGQATRRPGHANFRDQYFAKFPSNPATPPST